MARRQSNTSTEAVENPNVDSVTEEPQAPAAETTESTEAPAAEVEIDLSGFQSVAEEASQHADASTGELSAEVIETVNKAYRELEGGLKAKNAARSWLEAQMMKSVTDKDLVRARVFVDLKNGLSAAGGSATKAPADPTTAFVNKVAALTIAQTLVAANVPEGVDESWSTKVDELITSLEADIDKLGSFDGEGEAPEVSPVVRQAFKLSAGKAAGGGGSRVSGGPRRDVQKHIEQVFADKEVGTFLTMTEIAKARSSEYGDDRPSSGAVSSRLLPKDKAAYDQNGIRGEGGNGSPRGARKYADA